MEPVAIDASPIILYFNHKTIFTMFVLKLRYNTISLIDKKEVLQQKYSKPSVIPIRHGPMKGASLWYPPLKSDVTFVVSVFFFCFLFFLRV